jgi:hypothetical protein
MQTLMTSLKVLSLTSEGRQTRRSKLGNRMLQAVALSMSDSVTPMDVMMSELMDPHAVVVENEGSTPPTWSRSCCAWGGTGSWIAIVPDGGDVGGLPMQLDGFITRNKHKS